MLGRGSARGRVAGEDPPSYRRGMNLRGWLRELVCTDGGSTAPEYGLVVALVVMVILSALCGVSGGLGSTFIQIAIALQ